MQLSFTGVLITGYKVYLLLFYMQSAKKKTSKPALKIQILLHMSVPALKIAYSECFLVLHDKVMS